MALESNVTLTHMTIESQQMEAQFEDYCVGDFVQFFDNDPSPLSYIGMILKKENYPFISTIMLGDDKSHAEYWFLKANIKDFCKLFFLSNKIISKFKIGIDRYYPTKIDNLTYIEVLDRLRQYESKFS